jgi:PAS domain S-box-containing protein
MENGFATMEIAFLRKDGTAFPAEVSASLFEVGERKLIQGIIRDITHRARAEAALRESEDRKSAILETALDCILTINHKGDVLEFNPAAEKTFGYSRDEAVGRNMADLIVPHRLREQHRNGMLRHLETGEARVLGKHIELPAIRKDGTEFPVEVAITRIPTDGPPLFTGYLRDITDRKQAEETMRVAKEAAESTSRAKTEFVASVSHEVRTPLNVVMGMTDLALDTGVTPEQKEYLQAIRANSEVLLRLINDVLDFSKIEAGRMVVESVPVDLAGLVESVARSLQPRATNKGLEVTTNIDDTIPRNLVGDSDRLRQVLLNLIGNGIKFTSEGGIVVQLRSEGAHGDKERVHIEVRDTGVGIPDEMREKIFDRFFQIDGTRTRKYGGTGLGLSITRSLIELMGGRIWIDSTVDVGTAVHIELDMETSDRNAVLEPIAGIKPLVERLEAASGMATGQILLVEDHADNQKLATRILTRAGYNVDLAVNGKEAQEKARDFAYDLIFMDLEMPVMDGFEATRRIRALERSSGRQRVPIVALTAHAVEGYRERCLEVGMDDHLAKPVTRRSLLGGAETWVDRSPWVLVVEDSADSRNLVERYLHSSGGCRLLFAEHEDEVRRLVERYTVSMVLLDMELRGTSGYELAGVLRSVPGGDSLALVAMTGHRGPEEEKKCFEAGCSHYIGKPFSKEQLVGLVQEILGTTDTLETGKRPEDAPVAESLPPIDVDIDPELADLIPEFLDSCRVQAEELVTFIESGDFDAVRRAGHNLKGSGEPYGFHELTRLGSLIEQSAQSQEKNKLECYTEQLGNYLRRVRAVPSS